jgi:hypothetical protein
MRLFRYVLNTIDTVRDAYHVSPKEFTEKYGTQRELLQMVQDELNITGCKCGCTSAFNESFSGL